MTNRRYVIVLNPRGGTCRGQDVLERVKPLFAAAGAELEIHATRYAGHARELAATLNLDGCAGFCVVGGDGTLHEAVNGLLQRPPVTVPPLGVIPGGTGNAVAIHLGLQDPLTAARRIIAGTTQPLDVAAVSMGAETVYCLNLVGWGCVVDITQTAERWRWLGPPRYALAALWHILCSRRRHARVALDGQILEDHFLFAAGCNTKFTGKGMKLAPRAETHDGKLDVILVRHASRFQLLRLFQRLFDGSHVAMAGVETHQVRSFAITTVGPDPLNLDGELSGATPMSLVMRPGALRIFG